ncbi:MAG: hypothetical protein WBF06_16245, partial [Candidatus Acidiferrales bacterium]
MKFGPVRILAILLTAFCAVAFGVQAANAQSAAGAPSAQVAQSTPSAPANPGTLRGTVTDPSGAAVGQAAVVMM